MQFWLYDVEVDINVVRNIILNNFGLSDRFAKVHCFPCRSLQGWRNTARLQKMVNFCQLWVLLGRKTVQPSKSNTEIKVVQNDHSENLYLDFNIVRPKLNQMNFYFFYKMVRKKIFACKKMLNSNGVTGYII